MGLQLREKSKGQSHKREIRKGEQRCLHGDTGGPLRGYGDTGYGIFGRKIIGILDTEGKNYEDMGYLKKK